MSGKSGQVGRKAGAVFDNSGTNVGKTLRKIPDQIMIFLISLMEAVRPSSYG